MMTAALGGGHRSYCGHQSLLTQHVDLRRLLLVGHLYLAGCSEVCECGACFQAVSLDGTLFQKSGVISGGARSVLQRHKWYKIMKIYMFVCVDFLKLIV